ncbi:hypothetical protein EMCRGX_G028596 [Ephydatia muelleri]
MSVRGAVSFADARNAEEEFSVGLDMPNPPSQTDHGFHLNKGEFRDALCHRYDWSLTNVPQHCNCSKQFSVDHAMTAVLEKCATTLQQNHPYYLLVKRHFLISQPTLMLRPGRILEEEGFGQKAYFDVRVFHPNASSKPLAALFRNHKQAKKR